MRNTLVNAAPLSILVVEDDADIRFATVRLLKSAGYAVSDACSAAVAWCVIGDHPPDIVLLDVELPCISGLEFCRRLKTDNHLKNIAVMLLSGARTATDAQSEGLEIGADAYMTRPIANRELLARVQAMARIVNAERERDRLIAELKKALAEIRTLSGLLPICSSCKKIRDDQGYWRQIESYIQQHSEASFSHGICPACAKKLYPDIDLEDSS